MESGIFVHIIAIIIIVMACVFSGLAADENKAYRALDEAGYKDAEIYEEARIFPSFEGCSDHSAAFKVKALNPRDEPVAVVVCVSSFWTGTTIRH